MLEYQVAFFGASDSRGNFSGAMVNNKMDLHSFIGLTQEEVHATAGQ